MDHEPAKADRKAVEDAAAAAADQREVGAKMGHSLTHGQNEAPSPSMVPQYAGPSAGEEPEMPDGPAEANPARGRTGDALPEAAPDSGLEPYERERYESKDGSAT
ncbi:hypothetical protein GCM10007973_09270 [Polymorphobacter multimanifer]|uniref:Uncharacterized protein n=1 Tax=Polymorphobacter multimanifer TaxID=1070431 RepID=A0A841L8D4_9SPHN|nr:hypothetical protein [Polymorphobacter multimanifer]MBB6228456.1 hypothetical protein [Polymorphobacter multimanifer]GGI74558.1 hypothetical protein GCM10007973_09270 [Polymorphobacter multimanifer]